MNKKAEDEKIEILNLNLAEVKNVAETQKNELQYLKSELEKENDKKFYKISQKKIWSKKLFSWSNFVFKIALKSAFLSKNDLSIAYFDKLAKISPIFEIT